MSAYDEWLQELLHDTGFVEAWDDAEELARVKARLVARRRELGVTQAQLGESMGVTQSTISEFENSESEPYLSTLQRYARAVHWKLFLEAAQPVLGVDDAAGQWRPGGFTLRRAEDPAGDVRRNTHAALWAEGVDEHPDRRQFVTIP